MGLLVDDWVYISEWIALFAATFFVLIRLYVRVYCYGHLDEIKTYRWSEVFVVFAWLIWLLLSCLHTYMYCIYSDSDRDPTNIDKIWRIYAVSTEKINYVAGIIYKPIIYMLKFALLCFYSELCPKAISYKIWVSIMVAWVMNAIGLFIHVLYQLVACRPFYLNWWMDPSTGLFPRCSISTGYYVTTWSLFFLTDFIVYIIPFFIVKKLSRNGRKKAAVAITMFAFGFINIATAAAVLSLELIPYFGVPFVENFAAIFQVMTAFWIVCTPYVRRAYKDFSSWISRGRTRVKTRFTSGVRSTVREMPKIPDGTLVAKPPPVVKKQMVARDVEIGVETVETEMSSPSITRQLSY